MSVAVAVAGLERSQQTLAVLRFAAPAAFDGFEPELFASVRVTALERAQKLGARFYDFAHRAIEGAAVGLRRALHPAQLPDVLER